MTIENFSTTLLVMQQTPNERLASIVLGVDLEKWVAERRDRERPTSWLNISRELAEATNGQVSLSHEALRMRYGQAPSDQSTQDVAS